MIVTEDFLVRCGGSPAGAALYAGPLAAACGQRGVDTAARLVPMLANILNESAALTRASEDMVYSSATWLHTVYPSHFATAAAAQPYVHNPDALAAKVYGVVDGIDMRGRGLAELTGEANYAAYGKAIGKTLAETAAYLETPEGAADSAVWFYVQRGCLPFADRGDLLGVTRLWEGAKPGALPIGWAHVQTWNGQVVHALPTADLPPVPSPATARPAPVGARTAPTPGAAAPTTEDLNDASLAAAVQLEGT